MVQLARGLAAGRFLAPRQVAALDAQVRAMVRVLGCPGGPWYVRHLSLRTYTVKSRALFLVA